MKKRYEGIAVVDARNLTKERAEQIEEIRNVAMLVIRQENRTLLDGIRMRKVAMVAVLPEGAELVQQNGSYKLTFSDDPSLGKIYLLVNGELRIDDAVTPEMIQKHVCGGMINGMAAAKQSQLAALSACGVHINGTSQVIPDTYAIREGKNPLTLTEARMLREGERLYLLRRVPLEQGAAQLLCEKHVSLAGERGILAYEKEAQVLSEVWQSDSSAVRWIPDGFRYHAGDLRINARNARAQRGSIMAAGNVIIEPGVTPPMLEGLTALALHQNLFLPVELMEAMTERVRGDVEWWPYEGKLLEFADKAEITTDVLAAWPEQVTVVNSGVLNLSPEISPQLLMGKIALLLNEGVLGVSDAQRGALSGVICGDGHIRTGEKEPDGEDADTMNTVRGIAYLEL